METGLPQKQVWSRTEWNVARQRAIASKDPVCELCNTAIDLNLPMVDEQGNRNMLAVEVDHIVPRVRGGALYEMENLRLTHMRCNRKRGAKMPSDYLDKEYDNPVPLSNNW